ncbi:hypothetical protein [Psychrobacter ciconiae]|uniref:hypothetical protein n=1 Tax=Psychrobacter ciconiae TaxID=1553449 RepID=UPI001918AC9E|nr:hypothetical protein [Psychrobacter ciconiae]
MILIGIGAVTAITIYYLGRKSWHALHRVAGITPGVMTYQNPKAPLLVNKLQWQKLKINPSHLQGLNNDLLRQLQSIDQKLAHFENYQQSSDDHNQAPSEDSFIAHKFIYSRLPEMLASYYHLRQSYQQKSPHSAKIKEAEKLLQELLDGIEERLDSILSNIEAQHWHELKVMKRYLDTQR